MRRAAIALVLFAPLAACSDTTTGCRTDLDCGAGSACVAGECRPVSGADLGGVDAASGDSATSGGRDMTGVQRDFAGTTTGDGSAPICTFNGDGVIQRTEEPFIPGLGALFAVNPSGMDAPVDLQQHNGTWDYSAALSGDRKAFDQLLAPTGQWWSADFPTATHAEKLDDNQDYWGVYRATDSALQLLGIVSSSGGVGETELTYATPIDLIRFPLHQGDSWSQTSTVSGFAAGVAFAASETWALTVDARGTTKVPALPSGIDTLRLRIDYQQTYGFLITTRFIYLHLAECYGAVARVRSDDNETNANFTQAAEFRRLATQ